MEDSVSQSVFAGFPTPSEAFTRVPNCFIEEEIANINNLAELKIVLYVMRHTWGFQEYDKFKKITLDEFEHGRKRSDGSRMDSGTGLGRTSIKDGLKRAEEHGYLVSQKDEHDKGRVKKFYWLKMQGYRWE